MSESSIDTTFDALDFTTSDHEEEFGDVTWHVAVIMLIIMIVFVICIGCCVWACRHRMDNVTFDTLTDANAIRSAFKSIASLKSYLLRQRCSIEMIVSIFYLVITIILNTCTNVAIFWHYRKEHMDEQYILNVIGEGFVVVLEISLTFLVIIMPFLFAVGKYYVQSITVLIGLAPSISVLVYFTLVNAALLKVAKSRMYEWFESNNHFFGKAIKTLIGFLMTAVTYLVGVFLFIAKIQQISYIYDRDIWSWGWDWIIVLGTARQFSSLYSMNDAYHCWDFVFVMIHPQRKQQMRNANPGWRRSFLFDDAVCREVIERHGFVWGYLWLCHTFMDMDNVKEMYIAHDHDGEVDQSSNYEEVDQSSNDEEVALSSVIN